MYQDRIPIVKIVEKKIIPDLMLLKELLIQQSPSKSIHEDRFRDWVVNYVREEIPNTVVDLDNFGNIYIIKGDADLYPCIVAHLDTVHPYREGLEIFQSSSFIFGFDNKTGEQAGIGADDKIGVCFGLQMLKEFDNLKVFFALQEEIGGKGSYASNVKWFEDCSLLIQLDRRSFTNDIVEHTNGIQVLSEEFKGEMKELMKKYDYSFNRGTFTDVGCLVSKGVGCIAMNISNSSFNEHMDNEVIGLNHLHNAFNIGMEIISSFGYKKRWEHYPYTINKSPLSVYKTEPLPYKYTERYDDYYDWELPPSKKDLRHHSEDYTFGPEDTSYIEDCLEVGTCAVCNSSDLVELTDGEILCVSCEAIFNIPPEKSIVECLNEYDSIMNERY